MAHYIKNEEKNGIEIYFDKKPSESKLYLLKKYKWRWHPHKKCWYNRCSLETENFAKYVCGYFDEVQSSASNIIFHEDPIIVDTKQEEGLEMSKVYKDSVLKQDNSIFERDITLEKSFGIKELRLYSFVKEDGYMTIMGEVYADEPLKNQFCIICTLYDEDGDVIESKENSSYGGGIVTSYIKPECFFQGFPFSYYFFKPKAEVAKIKIVPSNSY